MNRAYYADSIANFLAQSQDEVLGRLSRSASTSGSSLESTQSAAWLEQIRILKPILETHRTEGSIYFEYSIPRLGKRIDVLALIGPVIFIFEFKVGEERFTSQATDQVWDYALDLKNFHETSHTRPIAPILIPTGARKAPAQCELTRAHDDILTPIHATPDTLADAIRRVLEFTQGGAIDARVWEDGRYHPTPTIVEAAMALYNGHSVTEISRRDASAINLQLTTQTIDEIINTSRDRHEKAICFVTGVPGAGKTLVGLNIATKHINKDSELYSVFLSGNDPLVKVLREALARDKVRVEKERGTKTTKSKVLSEVKMFIQNVHHFRDDCLADTNRPPVEHVAIFDEAQRAWTLERTASFMKQKKGRDNFDQSEPEFLISCMNRHADWAVVICLVGGGQEINTGEAGISEWIKAIRNRFPEWHIYVSSKLKDTEYGEGDNKVELQLESRQHVVKDELHLSVSMRSFRSESVSRLVKELLDLDSHAARQTLSEVSQNYPIVLTRDLRIAKKWLRTQARGTERYGIVVSSEAQRLKPHAIDVRAPIDPCNWFLNDKEDIRSSYYLEDVATEFQVQGLELDWTCVTWDGDFRYTDAGWQHWSFCGDRWNRIRKPERQMYLKNAYRVLLTRARQGMVIVVPEGETIDPTRKHAFYDPTFEYLQAIGFGTI